jgi:hypothetical protein
MTARKAIRVDVSIPVYSSDYGRVCIFGGPRQCGGRAVQGMPSNDSETVLDG